MQSNSINPYMMMNAPTGYSTPSSFIMPTEEGQQTQKKTANPSNFKIVKCKNFEREGICKYGGTCTFAHGDQELRSKMENSMIGQQGGQQPNMLYPNYMDPNLLMMMQSQMGMGMGMNMNYPPMGMFVY